ncbi:MAG: PAS domain S-box protein [Proteobacteria bacterium]|nr:PAS domain S-box protein [Pseudomonadota bacterium]
MSGQERRRGWPQWRGDDAPGAPVDPGLRSGYVPPSSGAIAGPAYARGMSADDGRRYEPESDRRIREIEWESQVPQLERLHALSRRLLELHDETALMRETMYAASELMRAQASTAQLRTGSGLQLIATGGLPEDALDAFRYVDANGISTCAAALRERRRVLVVNFDFAPGFAAFAREAAMLHLRAAVSTPVLDENGEVGAMFTLYFDRPFQPTARELRMLDLCAQQVAPQLSRVRVAAELRDSVGLNRVLLESGTDCIQMLDLHGRVSSINAQGRRVLGLDDRAQVEGRLLHELMAPECRPLVDAAVADAATGIPQKFETFGRAADGAPKWWSSRLSPIPDAHGQPGHLLLVSRDITAQKRDEQTLAEERRILGMVAEGRPLSECLDALTDLVSRLDPAARASVLTSDETSGGFAGGHFVSGTDGQELPRVPGDGDNGGGQAPAWAPRGRPYAPPGPINHSEPIFVCGKRAGSFFIELDPAGTPDEWHRRIATFGAHIAGLMLERDCEANEREQAQRDARDAEDHERAARSEAGRLARDSAWLAAIVDSSPDAVIGKDLDGNITSWNRSAGRLFGYDAAEAIGQPGTILMPADRVDEETEILARIRRGEILDRYETVRRHRNGGLLDISLTVAPIRNAQGEIVGVSKVAHDISARKQIERERAALLEREYAARAEADQLARHSAWLAAIVDSSHDAIVGQDQNGIITSWNRSAEELLGYRAEEAIGQPCAMFLPFDSADVAAGHDALGPTGETDQRETTCRHRDGRLLEVSLVVAPIHGTQGESVGVSLIARDIGARKQIERERAAALAREEEARREAELLFEAVRALAGGLEFDALARKMTDLAARLIGAEYGAFFARAADAPDGSYTLQAVADSDGARSGDKPFPRDTPLFRSVFSDGAAMRSGDARESFGQAMDPLPGCDFPIRSCLAVPVASVRNGEVQGGLFFAHPECDRFDERAGRLVQGIASYAAIALDNVHAHHELSLSENRLRQLIDAMPAAIYAIDAQGRLTHFNAAAAEISDGALEAGSDQWNAKWKLHGEDGSPLPPERMPEVRSGFGRPAAGIEAIVERADGTRRWFIPCRAPLHDVHGRPAGSIVMLIDISDRKRAEAELLQAHARSEDQRRLYDTVLSNTPDLICVLDLEHRFVFANDALLMLWGKTRGEALGRNLLELGYPGWHAAMHDRELDQVIASGRPLRGEVPFTGAFGRRIYEYVFEPVLDDEGEVQAVAGTSRDITMQKEVEHRQRFLLDLSDRLRLFDDANAIRHVAAEMLARELGMAAAGFAVIEPDGETLVAGGEFCDGRMPDIRGRRFSEPDTDSGYATLVLADEEVFIEDHDAELRKTGGPLSGRELGLGSGAGIALYNQGERVAYLYLMHPQPRVWPEADRQLVRDVAERTWSAVERVRALDATRRGEAELAGELSDMQLLVSLGGEMLQEADAEPLFRRIVETAAALMRSECASLQILDPESGDLKFAANVGFSAEAVEFWGRVNRESDTSCGMALRDMQRVIIGDVRQCDGLGEDDLAMCEHEGILATQTTPLLSRSGRLLGMLSTHWRQRHVPDERRLALLDLLARQAADLIENHRHEQKLQELNVYLERRVLERTADLERSEQQVRRVASMLTMAEHAERRRISQVLHDDLQQQLHGIQMKLSAVRSAIDDGRFDSALRHLETAENWSGEGVDTTRRLTVDLSPPILKSEGLAEALEWLVSQMRKMHGLDVILAGERELPVHDDGKRVLVYQVVRELLFNVVKYANTGSARIELRRGDGDVEIRVVDEGVGFDPQKLRREPRPGGGGFGLASAGERLALIGGRMEIESAPGFGACITLHVPSDEISRQDDFAGDGEGMHPSSADPAEAAPRESQDPAQDENRLA